MKVGNKEFIFPFSLWIEVLLLKELGEFLKEARENNGVSIEEASDDLKLSPSALDNIESGNTRAFNDMFVLKNNVRDYAKYLGLDPNQVLDEFNDFLFEHTSKISLDDIMEAKKNAVEQEEKEEKKKIRSPYTMIKEKKNRVKPILIILSITFIIVFTLYLLLRRSTNDRVIDSELQAREAISVECTY